MSGNPVVMVQDRLRELESGFRVWVSKQPLAVEAAVATLTSAAQGAAMGGLMGTLSPKDAAFPTAVASSDLKQVQALAGGPLIQARNFAVMTGVNAGISCVMKRIRGVEDLQTSMVAAFGSGAMFSLVSGMGGPNPAVNAVSSGLFFALIQGGLFQVGKKFSTPPAEDINYVQATNMLKSLGLDSYCKNFKKGMLNDNTLPLLTDSALSDVRIPPGPRLIILDHIRRDPELKKVRK